MSNELRDKIYDMSNHFLPLDMFYNDIENMAKYPSFNQESAFKDLEKIADFVLDLQSQLEQLEKERELDNSFWKQECDSLQKTLVEKEKEIDNLYDRLNSKQKFYEMSLEKDYKEYLSRLDKLEKQCDKDKISFAIEQLEQLKKLCQEKFNWWENSEWEGDVYDKSDVSNAYFDIEANIEEQINGLKERCKNE